MHHCKLPLNASFTGPTLLTACSAVRMLLIKSLLIGLLLLLGGCSMLRLSYNQGSQLVWWWLDGYVDFSREQAPHAKHAIRQWFDWHRSTQLPEYAAWLSALRNQINEPVTPEQVCGWSEELRTIVAPALDRALQLGAPLVPGLGEAQLHHIELHYAKGNDEFRNDYLQPLAEERLEASIQRTVKRIENFYGHIDEVQRRLITDGIETSPFDPEAWLAERQRRQHEILLTLRQLVSESSEIEPTIAAFRMLIEHIAHSTDADYRTYQLKLTEYNCAFVARMHNSTNSAQRRHAHDKLKGWENDLRILTSGS